MPRLTNDEEVKKALKQLKRDAGQKIRHVFSNKTYLNRITNAKLILLSYVTQKSRSSILNNITINHIQEYERKNGSLEDLALKLMNNKEF